MADDRTVRINAAVDQCLDLCSKSSTPPAFTIQGFADELRGHNWPEEDIEIVQSTATRIILQQAIGQ